MHGEREIEIEGERGEREGGEERDDVEGREVQPGCCTSDEEEGESMCE